MFYDNTDSVGGGGAVIAAPPSTYLATIAAVLATMDVPFRVDLSPYRRSYVSVPVRYTGCLAGAMVTAGFSRGLIQGPTGGPLALAGDSIYAVDCARTARVYADSRGRYRLRCVDAELLALETRAEDDLLLRHRGGVIGNYDC